MHVFLILTEEHACSVRNVRKAKKLQRNEQEKPDLSKINRVILRIQKMRELILHQKHNEQMKRS